MTVTASMLPARSGYQISIAAMFAAILLASAPATAAGIGIGGVSVGSVSDGAGVGVVNADVYGGLDAAGASLRAQVMEKNCLAALANPDQGDIIFVKACKARFGG